MLVSQRPVQLAGDVPFYRRHRDASSAAMECGGLHEARVPERAGVEEAQGELIGIDRSCRDVVSLERRYPLVIILVKRSCWRAFVQGNVG